MSTPKKKTAPAQKAAPKKPAGKYFAARPLKDGGHFYAAGDPVPCDAARAKVLGDLLTTTAPKSD